jgi:hypothetical protein
MNLGRGVSQEVPGQGKRGRIEVIARRQVLCRLEFERSLHLERDAFIVTVMEKPSSAQLSGLSKVSRPM